MGLLVSRRRVYDDPFEFAGIPRLPPQRPHEIHQLEGLRARRHVARQSARFHAVPKGHCPARLHRHWQRRDGCVKRDRHLHRRRTRGAHVADGISVSVISNGIDTVDGKMLSTGELTGRNTALYLRRRLARLECRNDLTPMSQLLRTLHDGATTAATSTCSSPRSKSCRSAGFGSLNGGQ